MVDTLEAALWGITTTNSYRDCILRLISLGDDTDTTAAVAGGIAGILYTMNGIPKDWLLSLRGREAIEGSLHPNQQ